LADFGISKVNPAKAIIQQIKDFEAMRKYKYIAICVGQKRINPARLSQSLAGLISVSLAPRPLGGTMGEFFAVLLYQVAVALIETNEFKVFAHHLFGSIMPFFIY